MNVKVSISDFATPEIMRISEQCSQQRLGEAVRVPCEQLWKRRLRSLPSNKMGYKSTRFWEKCAETVAGVLTSWGVLIEAGGDKDTMGLRQRFYGGPIPRGGPKSGPKGVNLAIPISPVSYGKVPADFVGELEIAFRRVGGQLACYLVRNQYRTGPRGGKVVDKSEFLFRLKGEVWQDGNPQVVPSESEFAEAAMRGILNSVR